jgi:hypothetical protein
VSEWGMSYASAPGKSRLHDLRFRRRRHHGDVCVRARSFAGARGNSVGLGHFDRGGRTRLSFEFGAPAVTTVTFQRVLGSESDCTDGQEICR